MPVCAIDLRPGGRWHFVWRGPDGTDTEMDGVYREIVPPERLVNTESWGGDWPETLNTLVLTEEDGTTTLACTVLYPSQEARDAALGPTRVRAERVRSTTMTAVAACTSRPRMGISSR
jgi:uncharacterized protein YndB with AHSA1/START domain